VKQLRSFLTLFTEKGHGDAQLLSVTREQGVIMRDKEDKEENHNFVPDDLSGYKYIEKGDFAINKMKAWQGSYAVSDFDGIVSPAYYTCKLKGVNKEFFSKAIRSKSYVPFFTQYSKGIRVGQWDLNPFALKSIPFFLPPIDEQQAIVSYIEEKCQKIDKLASELQSEIDYLKEYKQRLIADCVTGQVNVPGV
jgi:type I restriction enzyme S subunit